MEPVVPSAVASASASCTSPCGHPEFLGACALCLCVSEHDLQSNTFLRLRKRRDRDPASHDLLTDDQGRHGAQGVCDGRRGSPRTMLEVLRGLQQRALVRFRWIVFSLAQNQRGGSGIASGMPASIQSTPTIGLSPKTSIPPLGTQSLAKPINQTVSRPHE